MVDTTLVYKDEDNVRITWMKDVVGKEGKPDSLECTLSTKLIQQEKDWLADVMAWVYADNDNRDIKVNGKFYIVDDFKHA